MRVYLACTVRGDRGGLREARRIAKRLGEFGHEVLTAHLLLDDVEQAEGQLSEQQIYLRDMEWLDGCEAVVAEASGSTFGVGFEVGYVLGRSSRTGQRVFLLFDVTRLSSISRLIPGNAHPRCITFGYRSLEELDRFLREHFAPAVR